MQLAEAISPVSTRIVVFTLRAQDLCVLLVQAPPASSPGGWILPGGPIGAAEDIEASARFKLAEATGIGELYLEQLYTFSGSENGGTITIVHVGLASPGESGATYPDQAKWFAMGALPSLSREYAQMVAMAHDRLAAKLGYSTIACQFLPEEFTLGELQGVYEVITGRPVDKRNFRKSILARNHIEVTGTKRMNGAHRPANLYRVKRPGKVEFIK